MCRLYDVIHAEQQLTLVFEYLDQDLKKYLDASGGGGLQIYNIKVRLGYCMHWHSRCAHPVGCAM